MFVKISGCCQPRYQVINIDLNDTKSSSGTHYFKTFSLHAYLVDDITKVHEKDARVQGRRESPRNVTKQLVQQVRLTAGQSTAELTVRERTARRLPLCRLILGFYSWHR